MLHTTNRLTLTVSGVKAKPEPVGMREVQRFGVQRAKKNLQLNKIKLTLWCSGSTEASKFHNESVSQLVVRNRSYERILEEILKCIVVCRNCHADIHYRQMVR